MNVLLREHCKPGDYVYGAKLHSLDGLGLNCLTICRPLLLLPAVSQCMRVMAFVRLAACMPTCGLSMCLEWHVSYHSWCQTNLLVAASRKATVADLSVGGLEARLACAFTRCRPPAQEGASYMLCSTQVRLALLDWSCARCCVVSWGVWWLKLASDASHKC